MLRVLHRQYRKNVTCDQGGSRIRSSLYFAFGIGVAISALVAIGLTVFVPHPVVADTTATLEQNAFRFYVDNDLVQPADPWPAGATDLAENAAITTADVPPDDANLIRMRMSLGITGDTLAAGSQDFKLQYGEGTDCAAIVSWNDVGAASSATIWRGESDTNPADGTTISSALLSTAGTLQTYEEQNNSALNPNQATAGQSAEWDWLVENNGALHDTTYCFRMVKSDGTALNTYTQYPKIQTEATVFDSTLEGGNGASFTKPYTGDASKISFASELDGGGPLGPCTDARRQNWFYFSMSNALNQTLTIKLINAMAGSNENTDWVDHKPVYSYDQVNWYRISSTGTVSGSDMIYTFPGAGIEFTSDTVYIAHGIPYTYTDSENDLTTWSASPYVTVTDIGNSVQSRMMHLVTIQDTASPITAANKKVYWFIARQHGMEPMGSYAIQGVINFLIGSSDEAKLMRRTSIFKIIPMMNPDGAYQGWTTANAEYCNENRDWTDLVPNPATETDEVYNAHYAIHDWMTNGTPADAEVITDVHTRCANPGVYTGDAVYDGNRENPYEVLWKILDGNDHDDEFTYSGTAGLFNVEMYDQYYPTWGTEVFNTEGTTYDFVDHTYPTAATAAAYEVSYLKTIWAMRETSSSVFLLTQVDPTGATTPPQYTVVGSPSQYFAVFNNDKGGGISDWYDRENDQYLLNNLVDADSVLDPIDWNDGSAVRSLISTTNATFSVANNSGNRTEFSYSGELAGISGEDYILNRVIWGDGRIWTKFSLTNTTGSTIDWGEMKNSVNIDFAEAANFTASRDNSDDTPTPGTDNWWGMLGTGAMKSSAIAHYVGQSGGWTYDTYNTASDATYGKSNWYSDADGPTLTDGSTISTTVSYQVRPDTDVMSNEAAIDVYRNDIASPDTPTMTTGTFSSFDKQEGGLSFAADNNRVIFTYTNADTVTKKKPTYTITDYAASTAPVLSVNNAFLDGEDGSAHTGTTHTSTTYTSSVDTTNDIAYVQYLSDISANQKIRIGDLLYLDNVTVSGNIYSDEGTTPIDCSLGNKTVALRVAGAGTYTAECTLDTGAFSIGSITIDNPSDIVTVFLDGETEKAVTVTRAADLITTIDDIDLYQNRVVVRHEDAGPTTNANLDAYDSGNDDDIPFTVTGGALTVPTGTELHVWSGSTYTPGGSITTNATGGDLHIDDTATATLGSGTASIGRDILVDTGATLNLNVDTSIGGGDITTAGTATVTTSSGTPTITVSGSGSLGGGANVLTFYNLTLSGTPTLASNITVNNNLTLPSSVTAGTKAVTMAGTAGVLTGGGATLYDLTINPTSAGTITLSTSDLTVSHTLAVASGDTLSLGASRTLTSGTGGSVSISGTISGSGTLVIQNSSLGTGGTLSAPVSFDATSGALTLPVRTYGGAVTVTNTGATDRTVTAGSGTLALASDLTLSMSGAGTTTLNLDTNDPTATVTGDTTIGSDTTLIASSDSTLSLKGDYANSGTFTHSSGTVAVAGTTLQTFSGTMISTSAFNNLTLTNASGSSTGCSDAFTPGIRFSDPATVANTYTITTGDVKVEYDSGSTYTLNDINWNGQAAGTPIIFRNSTLTSGTWLLAISGSQNAISYVDVARSDASSGDLILADDGTNTDCSSNTNWQFDTPAVYSNIESAAEPTSLIITWTSNEGTTSQVQYGLTDSYGLETTEVVDLETSHTVEVSGLDSDTQYHYRVTGTDSYGNRTTSSDQVATTLSATTISETSADEITATSAVINWTTSRTTTSIVDYGLTTSYGDEATDSASTIDHSLALTGLTPGTTYHYQISGLDSYGLTANSGDLTFTTLPATTLSNIEVTNLTLTSATITWQTNHAATAHVDYGLTEEYDKSSATETGTTEPSFTLTDLTPGTTYHYRVISVGNTEAISADATFTTLPTTAISDIQVVGITTSTATLTWKTNHAANSKVKYGESTTYGSEVSDSALTVDHSFTLTGLKSGAVYHYFVTSVGNTETSSADATFTTYIPTPTIVYPTNNTIVETPKPTITGLSVSNTDVFLILDGEILEVVKASTGRGGTGNYHYSVKQPLAYGWHTLAVRARNADAKVSAESTAIRFKIDPPFITPTIFPPIIVDAKNASIRLVGLSAANSTILVYLDGIVIDTFSVGSGQKGTASFWRDVKNLKPGKHTIQLQAQNIIGKLSHKTPEYTFSIIQPANDKFFRPQLFFRYVVRLGDSLWRISKLIYGKGSFWELILDVNKVKFPSILNPDRMLQPGWLLNIPRID
ncbi:MAG: M14-type cytosolic carboxypeptidase [Patescibacteria group bacterium]|nr:M14-type cytosolic carboxypeptidase [Patescibacteria group bacterium]